MMSKDLEKTAFHEAGHICSAFVFKSFTPKIVTIKPGEDFLGYVRVHRRVTELKALEISNLTPSQRLFFVNACVSLWAGPVAESVFFKVKYQDTGLWSDIESISDLAFMIHSPGRACNAFINYTKAMAIDFVMNPVYKPGIKRVARTLLDKETLTARQAKNLFWEI